MDEIVGSLTEGVDPYLNSGHLESEANYLLDSLWDRYGTVVILITVGYVVANLAFILLAVALGY